MKNRYVSALLSSLLSIGQIVVLIVCLALAFTFLPSSYGFQKFGLNDYLLLGVGAINLIVGLTLFQIGASSSLTKVGKYMGSSLSKQSKLFIVILFSFALGTLITCAEPSILIVSKQVNVHPVLLIGSIAAGVGIFVVVGVLRIIFHGSLKIWYLIFYFVMFLLICLVCISPDANKRAFLPFIFDAGGVTTGSATVPFILSLGAGVAIVRGGRNSTQDSFGLVGMASIGPVITMTLLILFGVNAPAVTTYSALGDNAFLSILFRLIPMGGALGSMIEVLIALSPIMVIFFLYQFIYLKLPKQEILSLLVGFAFSFVGLSLFLAAAGGAMTPLGNAIGNNLGLFDDWIFILIAFVVGLISILCEPAVHVLTTQIETISDGQITRKTVLATLSVGVGVAIALSAIRAVFHINIMYIVVPGYGLALLLMFACPDIYTAMAFDAGGTASGPMSTSFVLPMIIGAVTTRAGLEGISDEGEIANLQYNDAFGVVALIALTPIIAIQSLGLIANIKLGYKRYVMRKQIIASDDTVIIHF